MIDNIFYTIPYLFFFVIVYCLSLSFTVNQNQLNTKININFTLVVCVLTFIIFYGFRGLLFSDWVQYYPAFTRIKPLSLFTSSLPYNFKVVEWEKGFVLYMTIMKTISNNYFVFQTITYLIVFIFCVGFLKDNIPTRYLPLGLVFFILFYGEHFSCNFLRNAGALSVFLYSTKFLKKRKFFQYTILNVMGSFFHISALFFIPLFFITNRRYSKKLLLALFITGNIIFILQFEFVKEVLSRVASISDNRISQLVVMYLERKGYNASYGLTIGYFERIFTFCYILLKMDELIECDKDSVFFINSIFFYILIFLYCSEFYILIERLSILFVFGYWIVYPQVFSILSVKKKNVFLGVLFLYGMLKTMSGHQDITFLYENSLLPHSNYIERIFLLRNH